MLDSTALPTIFAIIYCRVSSRKQRTEGSGLERQEHRCRVYAEEHGYEVEAVFPDDVTAKGDFMDRPGMRSTLAYLDANKGKRYVVIFDDLKRFARDTLFHLKLRQELSARDATVECLNFRFEDTPEGKLIETVIAGQGELERSQGARQVSQTMRARLESVNRHRIGTPDRLPKGTPRMARIGTRPGGAVRVAEPGRVPLR